jgi:hypothetical protein
VIYFLVSTFRLDEFTGNTNVYQDRINEGLYGRSRVAYKCAKMLFDECHFCAHRLTRLFPVTRLSGLFTPHMPLAAFAYGSFGDIVATAELLVKIVTLLHRSGKPSSVWEETEKELTSLDRELKYLILKLTPTLDPLVTQRVREEVANCNRTMVKFYAKISVPKNVWQTVLWARSEEKALEEFKMQVVEHRTALGVVLGLLNL